MPPSPRRTYRRAAGVRRESKPAAYPADGLPAHRGLASIPPSYRSQPVRLLAVTAQPVPTTADVKRKLPGRVPVSSLVVASEWRVAKDEARS